MTEERNQGAPARVAEHYMDAGCSTPPFSEPREWKPCPECGGGDARKRAFESALGSDPCPECGQPPRCWIGNNTKNNHCPRPATVDFANTGLLNWCGQHYVDNEIQVELYEWESALELFGPFLQTARLLGSGGGVLSELLEAARAEAETKVTTLRADIARIWEEQR